MLNSTATKVRRELRQHGATSKQAQTYVDLVRRFERESANKGEWHHILPKNCGWWKRYEQAGWNRAQVRCGFHISLHAYLAGIFPYNVWLQRSVRAAALRRKEESQKKISNRHEIISRYEKGWSASRIARKYKISRGQLFVWLREWGVTIRGRTQPRLFLKKQKWLKKLVALYKRGRSLKELGKLADISDQTVRTWLIEAKLFTPFHNATQKRQRNLPKIVKMYLRGKSSAEIAEVTGIEQTTILDWLHLANIKLRAPGWHGRGERIPPKTIAKAIRFYQVGLSLEKAANKAGFTPQTLSRYLRLRKINARPLGEARTGVKKDEIKSEVISLYRQGKSTPFIARKFDVTHRTILNWLHLWNEPVRRPGNASKGSTQNQWS